MKKQNPRIEQSASYGEKMIEIKVCFFTDKIAVDPGKIIPKNAWAHGVVRMDSNESHGIKSTHDPLPFNSMTDLPAVIEKVLRKQGIVFHFK